ncbi:MAG TPA: hypothetical protein VHX65_13860 [Pirellulales bacterium]|nr:hypothetical protein [Pirellulales bacterium]
MLTHDRNTVVRFAYNRVAAGMPMPGVFLVADDMPAGRAIDEILIAANCLSVEERKNRYGIFRCNKLSNASEARPTHRRILVSRLAGQKGRGGRARLNSLPQIEPISYTFVHDFQIRSGLERQSNGASVDDRMDGGDRAALGKRSLPVPAPGVDTA